MIEYKLVMRWSDYVVQGQGEDLVEFRLVFIFLVMNYWDFILQGNY